MKCLRWLLLAALVVATPSLPAVAQTKGVRYDNAVLRNVGVYLNAVPGASINVCLIGAAGSPCTPTTPIYSDEGLTTVINQATFVADLQGNFGFWAPSGRAYVITANAPGMLGSSVPWVATVRADANNTWTLANNFAGSGTRTFATPVFGTFAASTPYRFVDSSIDSTNAASLGNSHFLPYLMINLLSTSTGVPLPAYFSVNSNSTTASNVVGASNLVGAFANCELMGGATNSGCWAINTTSSLDAGAADADTFGVENNFFNGLADSGGMFPLTTRVKFGVVSTNNGNYPIHTSLLSTFANDATAGSPTNGNRPHWGAFISDAIDGGLAIGDVSTTAVKPGGPLKMVDGIRLNEIGTATAGANFGSVSLSLYDSAWNGSAAVEQKWKVYGSPLSGANPVRQIKFDYNAVNKGILDSNGLWTTTAMVSASANPAASGFIRMASVDTHCWRNNANSADVCIGKAASDIFNIPNAVTSIFITPNANPAAAGILRLNSTDLINWRNNANNADISLSKTSGDVLQYNATNVTLTIASGTATMTTAAIASLACGTTVTVAAAGAATTDAIIWAFNAAPAANPGELVVSVWPTSGNVNFQYCNPTAGSVTPNAATLNWRVVR